MIGNFTQAVGASLDASGAEWSGFLFHASSSGRIYVGTDISTRIESTDGAMQPNVWQHFVFTFDRGEAALYKNGQRIAYQSSGMTLPAPWRMLSIGSTTNSTLRANGYYDDVRVYDRALSTAEVTQLVASTAAVYTPPANPTNDLNRNWSFSRSYDGNGNVIGESKSFADGLGRSTQAQVKSQTTGHVLATQTVYSSGGKPVLSTLAAPTNNSEFSYKQNFITAAGSGSDYTATNFEDANASNPTPVNQPTTPGSVGYYYSTNNTLEPLTATTNYPFSLTEEYGGPLGGVKRAAGPGDAFRMGLGREGKGRDFPLLNELDHYLSLRPQFVPASLAVASLRLKGEKAVSINANGVESISFSDADGKQLATSLSGAQYPGLILKGYVHSDPNNSGNLPVFQDIHIPAAGPISLTVGGTGSIRIVNLLTEVVSSYAAPWPAITLSPGFYRVISERDNQSLKYLARYGEFRYSYYDDAGRVVATVAPRGLTQGLVQENQVKNASFDLDTGPVSAPKLWETLGDANAVYTETYGGAHSGTYHGTHYHGDNNYYAFTHQVITRLPNGQYTLRAWVKSSGGQSKAYLLARNFGGGIQYVTAPPSPNGTHGEWTLLELKDIQVINGQCDIGFESQANSGQYFFFDDIEFFRQPDEVAPQFVTRNTYSGAGTMLATASTDEGRTEYVYARDGRIRFSQSALQKQHDRFSYSNYDEIGRVGESGEYQMASGQGHIFENQLPRVVTYEAENGLSSNLQVATNWPGHRGAGFVDNLISQGNYVQVSLNVPTAGRYPVTIRYAAYRSGADRTMPVYVNGLYSFHAAFPVTNSWATWTSQIINVDLREGSNTLRLQHDGGPNDGWINVDYFDVTENKTPTGTSILTLLEERLPVSSLDPARYTQCNRVWYDEPVQDAELNGRTQDFVLGAVTKTSNGTNTTWYSYDELGRLVWLVQKAPGVGVKLVDYTYDMIGNVLQVVYQKGQSDAFYHHYTYDADRRLRTVHTSPDGISANQSLQARYFYYLHGPLKRVEIADRLQGTDYAYTVQGWLKSINNSQKSLDPGQDSPAANGMLKDLFGMKLDYFGNDYNSRQLTANSPYISLNEKEPRYDGTVRANSWQTVAADKVHAYAYRYDAKGQLLESVYGQVYGGNNFSGGSAYGEGNLSYDTHGNILTLRRHDKDGTAVDDFNYEYTANTNKLTTVKNQSNQPVLSYEYDVIGQMTRESETGKGNKYLRYDVTGKVTDVYRDASLTTRLASYAYNDQGFRASKVVYSPQGVAQNTTYYVTDVQGNVLSTYEQAAGQTLARTEVPLYGASRLGTLTRLNKRASTTDTLETRYELNDQLGNARVIFRKPTTKKYLATMNTGQASNEEAQFDNLPATRRQDAGRAYDDTYVAALNGVAEGPKKRLAVEKGDTVTFSAQALYFGTVIGRPSMLRIAPLATTAALLAPVPGWPNTGTTRSEYSRAKPNLLDRMVLGISITGLANKLQEQTAITTTLPAQLIRYRFYNENNELKAEGTRYVSSGPEAWQQLQLGFRVPDTGILELATLNQSFEYGTYFDHIEVEHTTSAIVQEQHQYAFGSPITGLNYTVGIKRYRHGYQGQFTEKDDETGYDSFELRLYNSRIGRWTAPDPEGQFNSPYVGMGNNPVVGTDPNGGWSYLASMGVGAAIGAGVGGYMGYKESGRTGMWGGTVGGAAIGGLAGAGAHYAVSNINAKVWKDIVSLDVTYSPQRMSMWCFYAAAEMANNFLGGSMTQEQYVRNDYGKIKDVPVRNATNWLGNNFDANGTMWGNIGGQINPPPRPELIIDLLSRRRPIISGMAGITVNGVGGYGHTYIIIGIQNRLQNSTMKYRLRIIDAAKPEDGGGFKNVMYDTFFGYKHYMFSKALISPK